MTSIDSYLFHKCFPFYYDLENSVFADPSILMAEAQPREQLDLSSWADGAYSNENPDLIMRKNSVYYKPENKASNHLMDRAILAVRFKKRIFYNWNYPVVVPDGIAIDGSLLIRLVRKTKYIGIIAQEESKCSNPDYMMRMLSYRTNRIFFQSKENPHGNGSDIEPWGNHIFSASKKTCVKTLMVMPDIKLCDSRKSLDVENKQINITAAAIREHQIASTMVPDQYFVDSIKGDDELVSDCNRYAVFYRYTGIIKPPMMFSDTCDKWYDKIIPSDDEIDINWMKFAK